MTKPHPKLKDRPTGHFLPSSLDGRSVSDGALTTADQTEGSLPETSERAVPTKQTKTKTVSKQQQEYDAAREAKLQQRRQSWEWNVPLLVKVSLAAGLLSAAIAGSYFYNSSSTASTLRSRAKAAESEQDYQAQAKWLRRYSLMRPGDTEIAYEMAIAADRAVSKVSPEKSGIQVNAARRALSNAIGLLGDQSAEQSEDLRRRLIRRLLQLGGPWNLEAERQVIQLGASRGDTEALTAMARAISGQLTSGRYEGRNPNAISQEQDYWGWLANQQVGVIIREAFRKDPSNIELIIDVLFASKNHPDHFSKIIGQASVSSGELRVLRKDAIKALRTDESSRAKLVLYKYLSEATEFDGGTLSEVRADALEVLEKASLPALERLSALVTGSKEASEKSTVFANEPLQWPPEFWDYSLSAESAKRIRQSDPEEAIRRYRLLMDVELESLPPDRIEAVYLSAGSVLASQGDTSLAIETWQTGVDRLGGKKFTLLRAIASARLARGEITEAMKVAEELSKAIDSAERRLARMTDFELSRAQRTASGRRLEAARWYETILTGEIEAAQGNPYKAIEIFREAVGASSEVATSDRVNAGMRLAGFYGQQGSWDQAGMVLDQVSKLDLNNKHLQETTVEAWTRAGNRLRAVQRWQSITPSAPLVDKVAAAEGLFNYQLRLRPEERNFDGIRSQTSNLLSQLNAQNKSSDSGEETSDLISRLEALQLTVPPDGVDAEHHLNSSELAESCLELARANPDQQVIQAFATERLAKAGMRDEAFERFEQFKKVARDPSSVIVVKARMLASLGEIEDAITGLLDAAEVERQPVSRTRIIKLASQLAARDGNAELAYRALSSLDSSSQNLSTLYTLASIARALPENSAELSLDGKTASPDELQSHWIAELKIREGENGPYGRMIKARRLIQDLYQNRENLEPDDARLDEARRLARLLTAQRPRWGEVISLGGWISAIEGDGESCVEQMRRGIAAGDARPRSRSLLIQQLVALGRMEEAERELLHANGAGQQAVDQYSTAMIELALKSGDINKSLELARDGVSANAEDPIAHLVLATTAVSSLRQSQDNQERTELIRLAKKAISNAQKHLPANDFRAWDARLRLALAVNDRKKIVGLMEAIEVSEIDEKPKYRMIGQGLVALKEYEKALPYYVGLYEADPTSESSIAIADLMRELDRPEDEIQWLRESQKRAPENTNLRNRLAQQLLVQSEDGQPLDFAEIKQLLSDADQAGSSNRLMYAVILGIKGLSDLDEEPDSLAGKEKLNDSESILRQLVNLRGDTGDQATRYLASLLRQRLARMNAPGIAKENFQQSKSSRQAAVLHSEITTLYESLYNSSDPRSADIYQYAIYLLGRDTTDNHSKIDLLYEKLLSIASGSLTCLDLGGKIQAAKGQQKNIPNMVDDWAQRALNSSNIDPNNVSQANQVFGSAGAFLLKMGFKNDGLKWLKKAYEKNDSLLTLYIVELQKAKQTDEAIDVCAKHFALHNDSQSATLFIELLLSLSDLDKQGQLTEQHAGLIEQATTSFDGDASLQEGLGTFLMTQGKFEEAVRVFQDIIRKNPERIRTLNNLAMAFTEIPGRESEGLSSINAALQMAGDNAELLDTKGTVLMASGRLIEAEQTFAEAFVMSNEPRHQFHLIVALLRQGKKMEAERNWRKLDLPKLDLTGLTVNERNELTQINAQFRSG